MRMLSLVQFYLPSKGYRYAARPLLVQSLPAVAEALWRRTAEIHAEIARQRQRRYTPGLTLVVRYLEWNAALFRALRESGMDASRAGALIEDITWAIYGPMTTLTFRGSRLRSGRLWTRVEWTVDLMFALFLTRPFQRRARLVEGGYGFDIHACPLASWCRDNGVPELTRYAACSIDHRMAQAWGVDLQRQGTIADGAPLCDFRFTSKAARVGQIGRQA